MKKILTPEDKKYLGRVCRYFGSLGMSEGTIEIDIDGIRDYEDIDWQYITHFSNNYSADIPEGLNLILQKVLQYIYDKDLIKYADVDSINWERLDIKIDCDTNEIAVGYDYGYYGIGDEDSTEWSLDDDESIQELFNILEESDVSDRELTLSYNGGGDSGYIESQFENGDDVPSAIEDWCYGELESLHGGWEINEGSQGKFTFNLDKEFILLEHQYNTEENGYDTIWEEKF